MTKIPDEMIEAGIQALKLAESTHEASRFPDGALGRHVSWVEHAVRSVLTAALGSQAAAPDGWVIWSGGNSPLARNEVHQRKYRDGMVGNWTTDRQAGTTLWAHQDSRADIVAYRLAAAAPPAPLPAHEAVPEWAQKEIKRLRKAEAASESTFKHWRERALKAEATSPADSQERLGKLAAAATAFLDMYVDMVNSGDCGFWNPEEDPEVINLRAALASKDGETGT